MIIRTISKQRIGGATEKKDQPEWTDGRSVAHVSEKANTSTQRMCQASAFLRGTVDSSSPWRGSVMVVEWGSLVF